MTTRHQEKIRLIAKKTILQQQYGHLKDDDLVPEIVLEHCRDVVRFSAKSAAELDEIKFP